MHFLWAWDEAEHHSKGTWQGKAIHPMATRIQGGLFLYFLILLGRMQLISMHLSIELSWQQRLMISKTKVIFLYTALEDSH